MATIAAAMTRASGLLRLRFISCPLYRCFHCPTCASSAGACAPAIPGTQLPDSCRPPDRVSWPSQSTGYRAGCTLPLRDPFEVHRSRGESGPQLARGLKQRAEPAHPLACVELATHTSDERDGNPDNWPVFALRSSRHADLGRALTFHGFGAIGGQIDASCAALRGRCFFPGFGSRIHCRACRRHASRQ